MTPDPGLKPTREVRSKISREFANDPGRLVEYYMNYQRRFLDRLRWAPGTDKEPNGAAEQGVAETTPQAALRAAADRQDGR